MLSGGSYLSGGVVHPAEWSPCTVTALYEGEKLVVGCEDGKVFVHGGADYATGVAVTSVTYSGGAISGHEDGTVRGKFELEREVPGAITELAWTSEGQPPMCSVFSAASSTAR